MNETNELNDVAERRLALMDETGLDVQVRSPAIEAGVDGFQHMSNYYPQQRDGRLDGIEHGSTESESVEEHLGRPVIIAL